jgi:hypothetical protein
MLLIYQFAVKVEGNSTPSELLLLSSFSMPGNKYSYLEKLKGLPSQ